MKKLATFISMLMCTCIVHVHAIPSFELEPNVVLTYSDTHYYISFTLGNYAVDTNTVLTDDYESMRFSQLLFHDDYFDYFDVDGMPSLPFYTVHLHLPNTVNAFYPTDFVTSQHSYIEALPYHYLPAQCKNKSLQDTIISYNTDYYDDYQIDCGTWNDWHHSAAELSDIYTIMGNKGVDVIIYPFHYDPTHKELLIFDNIEISVPLQVFYPVASDLDHLRASATNDALLYFDNYKDVQQICLPSYQGKYMIITSQALANTTTMADFIHHKETMGFDVIVEDVAFIGNTAEKIREYLYNKHHTEPYLRYVLLVGDKDIIPYSYGVSGSTSNPPTDIYYGCLDEMNIKKQKDLHPDLYIGRWPISSSYGLANIVNKSIQTELYLDGHVGNVALFSGTGEGENLFYRTNNWIYSNVIQSANNNMWGANVDGRDPLVYSMTMINTLNSPTWMFVYNGHGDDNELWSPYFLTTSDIDNSLTNGNLHYQPFGFSLSCNANNFTTNTQCFGAKWIASYNGGVSFFGPTVPCYQYIGDKSFKTMFKELEKPRNMSIAQFTANGMAKYYHADKVEYRKRHVKKMTLFADPSLMLWGRDCNSLINTSNIQSAPASRAQMGTNFVVDSLEKSTVYSITGQLVGTYNNNDQILSDVSQGVYVIHKEDINGTKQTTTKFIH